MSFAKIAQAAGLAAVAMYAVGCKDDDESSTCFGFEIPTDQSSAYTNGYIAIANIGSFAGAQGAINAQETNIDNYIKYRTTCWRCIFSQPELKDITCLADDAPTLAELRTITTQDAKDDCSFSYKTENVPETWEATNQPCGGLTLALSSDIEFADIGTITNGVIVLNGEDVTGTATVESPPNMDCAGALRVLAPQIAYGRGSATQAQTETFLDITESDRTAANFNEIMTCGDYRSFFCLMGGLTSGTC